MENKEKKNIITYTEELIETVKDESVNADNIVSIAFIYRATKDKKKIKGINIQLYGHRLFIVPDVTNMGEYFEYVTHKEGQPDELCRQGIFLDLIENKNFTRTDAAKLMKCSVATVNRILGDK